MQENTTYRIRTNVQDHGFDKEKTQCLRIPLKQTFNTLEILSLKLNQSNTYKFYTSDYGVIVGRVYANGGFGVPNAKISIFIEVNEEDGLQSRLLYNYRDTNSVNRDGVLYNLLPDSVDSACHQVVGTFPNKRLVLDNNDVIEIFDKYWKYTTTTNDSGDYMLFGIPTGQQTLHVNLDLSDCGVLSQRPRDLIGQGYNVNQFESPNKFKQSKDLKSLAQVYSEDRGLYVYPYWGESNESGDEIAITRCDIEISYKFEPTCIFMGSVITDKGSNAIGKNCTGDDKVGRMSDLATGEGSIEMIRKTLDGRVEEYPIRGNRLIDGDGVFCYQIPMNLDYVTTDEFGNMVPTDDPNKGIPTRTRVRFRISLDESPNDATARKRCRYLVPNNPRVDKYNDGKLVDEADRLNPDFTVNHQVDYEFGSSTKEESYRDLFWNKVYTVKNYIPRLQKNNNITNRKHTGIKLINHFGDNNPMPYNSLTIKLSFMYRLICVFTKVIIYIIMMLNYILGTIMAPFCLICKILRGIGKIPFVGWIFKQLAKPFCAMVISCIKLSSEFCDDGINKKTFYPGCWGCQKSETERKHNAEQKKINSENPEDLTVAEFPQMGNVEDSTLFTCVENSLAQENDATSFNFYNDWVNGVLYLPLWFRKITPKKKFLFGLFKRKAKDQWCDANKMFSQQVFQTCALERSTYGNGVKANSPLDDKELDILSSINPNDGCKKKKRCHEVKTGVAVQNGLVVTRETMLGQTVYYYQAVEYDSVANDVILLFATDIVLLGSLNDCDLDGTPQFYKSLEPTSFNQPTDILFTDTQIAVNDNGEDVILDYATFTEATGADWGNLNSFDECGKMGKDDDGGLFYGIGCNSIEMLPKTPLNLSRICEFGVTLDNQKYIPNLNTLEGTDDDSAYDKLIPDGFVSFDELFNHDERSMFATMNGNKLRTKPNSANGLPSYFFRHYNVNNFDGGLKRVMENDLSGCQKYSYGENAAMETASPDYYLFRMGERPYFYNWEKRLPRYENSFYFYFGLKAGKTAIEKFNSQFFAPCETVSGDELAIGITAKPNDWCAEISDNPQDKNGYVKIDLTGISTPYDIIINSRSDASKGWSFEGLGDERICFASSIDKLGDEKEQEGFVLVSDGINLPNDEYELNVIDADGQIMTVFFTMGAKKVSFSTNIIDFLLPNNQKLLNYTTGLGVAKIAYENKDGKIGGQVIVTQIIDESVDEGVYLVTIKPHNTLPSGYDDYEGAAIKVNVSREEDTENGGVKIKISPSGNSSNDRIVGVKDNQIIFGVPYGDFEYTIEVTQLCGDDISTLNSSSSTVKVGDPVPFKLFINDVDIEIFKKGEFNVGWDIKNNNSTTPAIGNLKGWDKLSVDNGKYDWDKLTDYQKLLEELETATEEDEKKTIEEEIEKFKEDYIAKIKEVFWLTCPSESKDLTFRLTTNQYPVVICHAGDDEDYSSDVSNLHVLTETRKPYPELPITETDTINDIGIPTLTNFDNTSYGPKDSDGASVSNAIKGNISFGYDRVVGRFKRPYFVAGKNGIDDTIPNKIDLNKLNQYFQFHIVDKTLRFTPIAWSYVNELPYFLGRESDNIEEKKGKLITMGGLLAGWIYNGMVTDGKFDEQIFGLNELDIITTNDEDAIPTKRFITFKGDEAKYPGYKISGATRPTTYTTVENRNSTVSIEDSSCTIDETIYGKMSVRLSSSSIATEGNKSMMYVSTANGDNNGTTRFFVFPYTNFEDYPYNKVGVDNKFPNGTDYSILGYDKMLSILQNPTNAGNGLLTGVTSNWKNDADIDVEGKGYSETGAFKMNNESQNRCFVVAVTENNCCAISPVYDFTQHKVIIGLFKDNSGSCRLGVKVSNVITNTNKILYYIKEFAFHVQIQGNIGSSPITGEIDMLPVENYSIKANNKGDFKDKNQSYAIEEPGATPTDPSSWKVYTYTDVWETTETTTLKTPPDEMEGLFGVEKGSNWKFIHRGGKDEVPKNSQIKWDGNVWVVSELGGDDENIPEIPDNESPVKILTKIEKKTQLDEDGITVIDEWYEYTYVTYEKTSDWVVVEETDTDPTLRHYEKWAETSISEQQYNQLYLLSQIWGIGASRIRSAMTITVTDYTGLPHNCYIEKIVLDKIS